jgi:hypothetical protein
LLLFAAVAYCDGEQSPSCVGCKAYYILSSNFLRGLDLLITIIVTILIAAMWGMHWRLKLKEIAIRKKMYDWEKQLPKDTPPNNS